MERYGGASAGSMRGPGPRPRRGGLGLHGAFRLDCINRPQATHRYDRKGGHKPPHPDNPDRLGSAPYYMQHIVLAGVMADAAMVNAAIEADIYQRDAGRRGGG
eukprot:600157-Prymnesium_polylepis.1